MIKIRVTYSVLHCYPHSLISTGTPLSEILSFPHKNLLPLPFSQISRFFFMAAPWPTLGHCQGGSLTNMMFITTFDLF